MNTTRIKFCFVFCLIERLEHRLLSKQLCPKKEGALASNEFITKLKVKGDQNSVTTPEDQEGLEEQLEAANLSDGSDESQEKPNGQMWHWQVQNKGILLSGMKNINCNTKCIVLYLYVEMHTKMDDKCSVMLDLMDT